MNETVDKIRSLLVQQLEAPVQWEQTVKVLLAEEHIEQFIDAGPGAQLQAMMRRIDMKAWKKTTAIGK